MSSHREAPEIAKDPVADGTDTYAFMHPTEPDQDVDQGHGREVDRAEDSRHPPPHTAFHGLSGNTALRVSP